jgi:hypothetical protein
MIKMRAVERNQVAIVERAGKRISDTSIRFGTISMWSLRPRAPEAQLVPLYASVKRTNDHENRTGSVMEIFNQQSLSFLDARRNLPSKLIVSDEGF